MFVCLFAVLFLSKQAQEVSKNKRYWKILPLLGFREMEMGQQQQMNKWKAVEEIWIDEGLFITRAILVMKGL